MPFIAILISIYVIYNIQGNTDDGGFQQTMSMLDTVPQYWIPMLNPIVTIITVKQYRLRLLAIFGLGNRVVPAVPLIG